MTILKAVHLRGSNVTLNFVRVMPSARLLLKPLPMAPKRAPVNSVPLRHLSLVLVFSWVSFVFYEIFIFICDISTLLESSSGFSVVLVKFETTESPDDDPTKKSQIKFQL